MIADRANNHENYLPNREIGKPPPQMYFTVFIELCRTFSNNGIADANSITSNLFGDPVFDPESENEALARKNNTNGEERHSKGTKNELRERVRRTHVPG